MTDFLSPLTPRSPEEEATWRGLIKEAAKSYTKDIIEIAKVLLEAETGLSDARTCLEGLCHAHSQDPTFMHLSLENTSLKEKLSAVTVNSLSLQIIAHVQAVNDALEAEAPPPLEGSLPGDLSSRISSRSSSEASFSDALDAEGPPTFGDSLEGDFNSCTPSWCSSEESFYSTK